MNFIALGQTQTHLLSFKYPDRVYWGKYLQNVFFFLEEGAKSWRERELGGWEDFKRNTLPRISASSPCSCSGGGH